MPRGECSSSDDHHAVSRKLGFAATLKTAPAFSFGSKYERLPRDPGPGPGAYLRDVVIDRHSGHGIKSHERSAPAYSMPGKYYKGRDPNTPAPCDYDPKDRDSSLRKSAPAFSMHGAEYKDSRRSYPGPGKYDVADAHKALKPCPPAITISERPTPAPHSDRSPGPGQYSYDYRGKEVHTATIKFRHEVKCMDAKATPAPHDYADKDFCELYSVSPRRKGYTFGIRHKQADRDVVPGPQYKVGCSTLGVGAQQQLPHNQLSRSVVL